jgi:uncharacterized phiE125 gp8 family phage protein
MAILINSVTTIADAAVEPVSRTDVKNWLRIDYTSDDTLIDSLISAARQHLEKLTGRSLANKKLSANIELTGEKPEVWVVDLPYSPVICVDSVNIKEGINDYELLTANDDYEVIGGKLWLYGRGIYTIVYQAGYGTLPYDLRNDLMTLVAWMYENRGKKMNADPKQAVSQYPMWEGLNYHQYKTIVI